MKLLLFSFLIALSINLQAQITTDTIPGLNAKELELTPEQKLALKKLVWEYKLEDRRKRRELRHRMFLVLNVRQQIQVRRWWRWRLRK